MSIKTILVPLDRSDIIDAVMNTALAVAQRFEAHIKVLYVRPNPQEALPFLLSSVNFSGQRDTIIEAAAKVSAEEATKARASFDAWCANHSIPVVQTPPSPGPVSAAWVEEQGSESDVLIHHGRLADLIMVARPERTSPAPMILETAVMETGRSVLVVPPASQECIASHIAIGWNGSAEAARAVAAVMPCLPAADNVSILITQKRAQMSPTAEELAEHLAWHGVSASVHICDISSKTVGESLLLTAAELGADLLVVGAYSHTRFREVLLGGVTSHLLTAAEMPVFMAH